MATSTGAYLTVIALLIATAASDTTPTTYTNHTVGGPAGWFFNATTNTSSTNFSSWAASQTFYLGEYLIFDTSTNQTVFQTYNQSTYLSCTTDDSSDNDTFQVDGGSNQFDQATIVPVPLTIVGIQYYFSDADDGVQCQNGMAFEINVDHGLGLPPSLNQPPPPPYVEPPSTVEAGQSPPGTVVNQPNGGGRTSANVRRVIWVVLLFGGALVLA